MSLIAYIGEKVRTEPSRISHWKAHCPSDQMYRWSSPETHLSPDFVIANCMLYWFTGSITSSFWLYYLRRSGDGQESKALETTKINQPVAFGCGNYEIHWPVRKVFEMQLTDIRSWQVLEKGGHFLAAVSDLRRRISCSLMSASPRNRKRRKCWLPTWTSTFRLTRSRSS